MLIIPEIEKIVILVPRNGSSSIVKSVLSTYTNAFLLYRHMEADGIPAGYDRWQKVGVLREPIERLCSLYHYCKNIGHHLDSLSGPGSYDKGYTRELQNSVKNISFTEWLLYNKTIFTNPNGVEDPYKFYSKYFLLHPMPENIKSQYIYLRPDLGTKIYKFNAIEELFDDLCIPWHKCNSSNYKGIPSIYHDPAVDRHITKYFSWDLAAYYT